MTEDDFPEEVIPIYPENEAVFDLFCRLSTQWRASGGVIYGLDYGVMFRMLDRLGLSAKEYDRTEDDIRHMEDIALQTMREGRE